MTNHSQSADMAEIWSLFAQESRENLALAEDSLLELEQQRTAPDRIAALFRAIHSFKGGARMMGLSTLEALAHHGEDLIALVRDEGVVLQDDMIEGLLVTLDKLRAMLDAVLANECDVDPAETQDMVERLAHLIARYQVAAEEAPSPIEPSPLEEPGSDQVEELCQIENLESPRVLAVTVETIAPLDPKQFLQRAEQGLSQLHAALDVAMTDPGAGFAQVQTAVRELTLVAEALNYERLLGLLDDLVNAVKIAEQSGTSSPFTEESLMPFRQVELDLFEELTRIQEAGRDQMNGSNASPDTGWTDIAWLFRHWHADRVFSDLAHLAEAADQLEHWTHQSALEIGLAEHIEYWANAAMILLRGIGHSCIFYHLHSAVHLTLALEDFYARVMQRELLANEALLDLTRAYGQHLGSAIDAIREGATPDLMVFDALIEQIETALYVRAAGPVHQTARQVLEALNLAPQFKDVMTPEAWAQFSRSLQAGEHFYTILADLERDPEVGAAFYEWSGSAGIHLITNITVYRDERSLYSFLLATTHSLEAMQTAFARFDPAGQYCQVQECALRPEAGLTQPPEHEASTDVDPSTDHPVTQWQAAAGVLDDLIETTGEMAASHATLHRVVGRLTSTELVEPLLRVIAEAAGDGPRLRRELTALLNRWTDDLRALEQVDNELGTALGQLQDSTRQLRQAPVAELALPVRRLVHDLSRQLGKSIDLTFLGGEQEADRLALQTLAEPLQQLVYFAGVHGLEPVDRRQALGKPATGHIQVTLRVHDDHIQLVIEDDGRGLDRERLKQRAQELKWIDGRVDSFEELALIFKPGFGPVGGAEGIDLSAVYAGLRSHNGQLSVTSEPDKGTRFALRLPLDIAVVDGLVVRVGRIRYVIPVNAIRRIVKPVATDVIHSSADGDHQLLRVAGQLMPIRALLGNADSHNDHGLLVIVDHDQAAVALAVDELIGRQQVLARPLQGQLSHVRDASGYALLGEGEVGMILNLGSMN